MADKKISALTGAALPLAGTEVLPIVQSGSTVKVASNDLTTRNFRAAATTGILQVSGPTNGATRTMTVPDANFSAARTDAGQSFSGTNGFSDVTIFSGSGNPLQVGAPPASRCIATFSDGTYNARIAASPPEGYIFVGAGSNHPVGLVVNNNVSATFDTSGNTKLENGNLIVGTAGKGIAYPASGGGSALAPAFSAYKNANQAIAAFTPTKIEFQTEDFDTNTNYDASTGRFTPTVAGYYQVNWGLLLNDTVNSYYTYVYKNGSVFRAGTNTIPPFPVAGQTTQLVGSALVYLNGSTDYVEIYTTATGAGQINSDAVSSFFQACMVRGS